MKCFKRNPFSKPKLILFLVFLFFVISLCAFIIGFEMYLNENELLEKNFKNEEFLFYVYFLSNIGLGVFFFFLGKNLLNYKKWTWFFLMGSNFVSLITIFYRLIITLLVISYSEITEDVLNGVILNFIFALVYIYLIIYFLEEKIKNLFTN